MESLQSFLVYGKYSCKKFTFPCKGPATAGEEDLQLSAVGSHFHKWWLIAIPGKKGRGGSWTFPYGRSLVCVRTIKYSLKWASLLILPWLSVSHKCFCFTWRLLRGFCSEQALVLLCLWVCPICMKTLWNWFSSDSASLAIAREHFLFSLTHFSGLETSDNYVQDFNNTNATQSNRRETGREGKEKEKLELNVCNYSYGITSEFFFSCLITLSWKGFFLAKRIGKDNFLIETTYGTANFGKKNLLQSGLIAKISSKL